MTDSDPTDDPDEGLTVSDDVTEPGAEVIASDLGPDTDPAPPEAEEAAGPEAIGVEGNGAEADVVDAVDAVDADVVDAEDLLDEEPTVSPYDRPGRWFVVHTQSGYEKKVKSNLEARISSMNMEERIHEVVIPMEDVVEFKAGKKVIVQKKMFPGYLLVRCELDDDSWYVIRNTPGVTGFVGQGAKPSPLPRKDV